MKFVRDLSNPALKEWLNDPVEEHPIWQAIFVLMAACNDHTEPWFITKGLVAEAYRRRLIDKTTYEEMVG
jgi:hypothetical protein